MKLNTFASRLHEERGNCFLYGCVTLVILGVIGGLVGFLAFRHFVGQAREQWTEAEPTPLPTIEMPADQIQALITRVDDYAKQLRAGGPLPPLTLSESDVNALIQNHPDVKDIYGHLVYVTLEDGAVTGTLSVPVDWFPGLGGRYFNGTATFDVDFGRDDVDIHLQSASVKGEQVPEQYLAGVKTEDFADEWDGDPDARSLIDKIDSVVITKGSVTVTPVNNSEAPASGETGPAAPPTESEAPSVETPTTPETAANPA